MRLRRLTGVVVCLLVWSCYTLPATAHANYVRSAPAANSASPIAPTSVQVWFSEEVTPGSSSLTVYDARGVRVDKGDSHQDPRDARALVATLQPLAPGTYTVVWETLSAIDGHTARASFPFTVGEVSDTAPFADLARYVERSARALQPPLLMDALLRWLLIGSFALLAGGYAFAPLLLAAPALADYRQALRPRRRRLLALGLVLAGGMVAVSALVNLARGGAAVLAGRFGIILLARIVLLGLLAFVLWRKRDESPGVLLPAALLLLTQSLLSHSAAEPEWIAPVLADWIHFIFTALWLGGVIVLAVVVAPVARRRRASQ